MSTSNESRRHFLQKLAVAGAVSAIAPSALMAAVPSSLIVLHTNDMHSQIEPLKNDGRKYGGMGGMARRAALIEQIRAQDKPVLLLDSGDIFQGTPYFNYFGGELEYKLMNAMGYDACTLGNHDFDNGIDGLKKMQDIAQFKTVNANYNFGTSGLAANVKPYQIFRKAGQKIGVFGLGIELQGLVPDRYCAGIAYKDPIAVAKEMVQQLQKEKCSLIICLSHLGYEYAGNKVSDLTLATTVKGIHLILGGHTHTFLEKPKQIPHVDGDHITLVNQVGWAGINLGQIEFSFSPTKPVEMAQSQVFEIGSEIPQKG
jgi:5'-nucleotidase